jgi:hypothetical protein
MTVETAFENVFHINRAMTRLISLGNKIDAHQHPQQIDSVFAILKIVDAVRIKQIGVAKDYSKTADRLGYLRSLLRGRDDIVLGGSLEDWFNLQSSDTTARDEP